MESRDAPVRPTVLADAPEELTRQRLRRLGEGIGKVVYASEHWVVRRERSPSEIAALIILWKLLRKLAHILPGGERLLQKPSRKIRLLRLAIQAVVLVLPRGLWYTTHVGAMWRLYRERGQRGELLARSRLRGTGLLPNEITFPPTRVQVGGWPGWLTVSQAVERIEATLHARLAELAAAGRFDELEQWLNRLLEFRQSGWRRGLFSMDAHLKNFGVCGDRIVLIDTGGLTDSWSEIESHLEWEEDVSEPHVRLGLGPLLASRPDIAERFDARWRAAVSRDGVRRHWPE